jgi:hypothetical protein
VSVKKRKTITAGKRKTRTAVEDEPLREKLGVLESAGKEGRKRSMLVYLLLAGGGVVFIVAIVALVLSTL